MSADAFSAAVDNARARVFRAKTRRREELTKMPLADKVHLIESLHAAGMRLREVRNQVAAEAALKRSDHGDSV